MTDSEKLATARDIRELIESSGIDAVLLRKQVGEHLYSSDDGTFTDICSFKLEFVPTPPEDIADKVDATASALPDLDIQPEDRVNVNNKSYRVQTVVEESLFGVVTHKTLKLVAIYGS